jgi:negative regulator of flagellin synthesis FlgM
MKIGNPTDKTIGATTGPRTEGTSSTSTSGKTTSLDGGVGASSKVTLSSAATGLLNGVESDFDADKVSAVKQSIDDGSYKVSPEVIADKLINNARDLLQPKRA